MASIIIAIISVSLLFVWLGTLAIGAFIMDIVDRDLFHKRFEQLEWLKLTGCIDSEHEKSLRKWLTN